MRYLTLAIAAALVAIPGCLSPPGGNTGQFKSLESPEAFLWPEPYETVVIHSFYAPAFEPSPQALRVLAATFEEVSGKPIDIARPQEIIGWAASSRKWQVADLERLIAERSTVGPGAYGEGSRGVFEAYYLDGSGPGEGVMVDGRVFLFSDDVVHFAPMTRELRERTILIHEFGHAIGLVNCGIPMVTPREVPSSACHSSNRDTVMRQAYIMVDATFDRQGLHAFAWQFDEQDLADIAAFRQSYPFTPPRE